MLCSLAQFKTRYGISLTADDAAIERILLGVSAQLAIASGRVNNGAPCLELSNLTVYRDAERLQEDIELPAWPIVSIASVKEALNNAFSTATALVADSDYYSQPAAGKLWRMGWWLPGRQTVQVVYSGGYTFALPWVSGAAYVAGDCVTSAGVLYRCVVNVTSATAPADDIYAAGPPATGHWTAAPTEVAVPDDIIEAALQQAGFHWQRRRQLGLSSESISGANVSAYAEDDLLPGVRTIMHAYRRI
ncbi:MAG: carbohydrate-binding protein [Phycisphaerae bacterium]